MILAVGYNNAGVEREGADHAFTTLPPCQLALADAVIAAAAKKQVPVVMLLVNVGQVATDNLAAQPQALSPPLALATGTGHVTTWCA